MASEDLNLEEALSLTTKYLPSWKQLSIDDVTISSVTGGLVNRLYKLTNNSTTKTEPNDLLIRIYGGTLFDGYNITILTEPEEVLLSYEISKRKLGPKLYGVFKGGMLTEFVPNHHLNNEDLANPTIKKEIARNLAKYHALDIPINKTPINFIRKIEQYLELLQKDDVQETLKTREAREVLSQETIEMLAPRKFKPEINWLCDQETKMVSPLVFSILDNHRFNCLVRDVPNEKGERVMLIDYECSQMAPRGVDLGNEFFNFLVDASNPDMKSGLDYPSEEIRREYVEEYLKEAKRQGLVKESDDVIDSVDHVIMEAEFYGMILNVMFALMMTALLPGFIEQQDRAMHYPLIMLTLYKKRKAAFIEKYGAL